MDNRFIQGTDEWREMRRSMIMASDSPIIMGVSPWKNKRQLWEEKVYGCEDQPNYAMNRGTKLESHARRIMEDYMHTSLEPKVVIDPSHSWLGASLDGMSPDGIIAEIKAPGKVDHEIALSGSVPEKYFPQLQHQMLVTRADKVVYFSYNPDHEKSCVFLEVAKDERYMGNLFLECKKFYQCILTKTPPERNEAERLKDWIPESVVISEDQLQFFKEEQELFELIDEMERMEAKQKDLRDSLIRMCQGTPSKGKRFFISPTPTKGRVNYAKIPELKGVDLDQYRSEATISWRFNKL